jgi:hypothetical protein
MVYGQADEFMHRPYACLYDEGAVPRAYITYAPLVSQRKDPNRKTRMFRIGLLKCRRLGARRRERGSAGPGRERYSPRDGVN